ncbi:U-box domain-containing protein 8 [Dorcoceras hygrometricum]|uniref:RING-type E3 ubiquitin transferase n=1 Tax=Dorcoceras hygrometricum TaxID=472368 RepID=A0A2Z7D6E0_9LAMI|nr:U-box domain-containing protein 8 [Dorcoceras hygrometricum]
MATHFPDDFKCPISLEIMSDPVILSSGHTFDRASIQQWLDAGHRTCPISKLPLPEPPSLIPNHALRSLISNYSDVTFPKPQARPPTPQTLSQILLSPSSSWEDKLHCLEQLTRVSKTESSIRRRFAESGLVSAVLSCVDSGEVGLVAEGIVGKVVHAVRDGAGDSRAVAATVLTSLAMLEVNKVTIGSYPDAIPGLVALLQFGNSRERKEAATALFTLCSFPDNRVRIIQNRAVPILIQNANSGLERAIEVLGLLAKCRVARDEMMRCTELLDILIAVLKNGSSRGVQYALLTLSCLCCYSEKMALEASKVGLPEICVGLLEDDNEKVRRNAKTLIQVLQGKRTDV